MRVAMGVLAVVLSTGVVVGQERPDRFALWDRDGDGRLSREELPERIRANFGAVDRDGDGFVSRAEHDAVAARLQAKAAAGARQARVPGNVKVVKDLDYVGAGNPRQMLDLVLPAEREAGVEPLPLVVFIHGGAWRGGSKEGAVGRLAPWVATGEYAGAAINYRLTGEASWPAQIHDCKAAIRWLRAHAGEYGFDPERIGVMGSSAGGHLVAMLGTSGGIDELAGELGEHLELESRVACVVDEYGPSELLMMGKFPSTMNHESPSSPESLLVGGPILEREEVARAASPITYVSADDPPFLIIHGTKDMTVPFDQSERLHKALVAAGVESIFIPVTDGGHGGFRSRELERRIRLFLDRHLRGEQVEIPDTAVGVGEELK